jgi:hypothetical protein
MPPQTHITEKRIRMSIMLFMHINVGAGLAPYTFQKIMSHFRTHFPHIFSHRNQRNVEVIPGRQVASLLLIYGRAV